jgi:hypothetical protein
LYMLVNCWIFPLFWITNATVNRSILLWTQSVLDYIFLGSTVPKHQM